MATIAGIRDGPLDRFDQVGDKLVRLALGDDGRIGAGKPLRVESFHPTEGGTPIRFGGLAQRHHGVNAGLGAGLGELAAERAVSLGLSANGAATAIDELGRLAETDAGSDEIADGGLLVFIESAGPAGVRGCRLRILDFGLRIRE